MKGADGDGCVKWTRRRNVGKSSSYESYKITHFPKYIWDSEAVQNQAKGESRSAQMGQLRKALHTAVGHLGTSVIHSK